MPISLNHTIVSARDKVKTATFLTEILGLPPHTMLGHFAVVQVDDTSLDFVESDGEILQRHFAFLVSETEFDAIFGRIRDQGLSYWADRSEEHTSELQSLMRISYAVFCLKKQNIVILLITTIE